MSENYFDKFPIITYSNTLTIDISRRVVIANTIQQDMFAYFPYEMKAHQRPDTIAERYYNDPTFDWLVYLSNKVTDPYYDLPMDDSTFYQYINAKYGNVANAQQKILYWQVDWASNVDDQIDPAFFTTNVPEPEKKYYEAVFGEETRIIAYRRRRADWQASTNMVLYFSISNTSGTFLNDEVVRLMLPAGNTVLSNSYVTFSNSSQVTVQHVMGNVSSNDTTQYLLGTVSGAKANVSQITVFSNTIPLSELAYWAPVYAWDMEVEENERKKFIRLIDSKYSISVAQKLRKDLQT